MHTAGGIYRKGSCEHSYLEIVPGNVLLPQESLTKPVSRSMCLITQHEVQALAIGISLSCHHLKIHKSVWNRKLQILQQAERVTLSPFCEATLGNQGRVSVCLCNLKTTNKFLLTPSPPQGNEEKNFRESSPAHVRHET